MRKPRELKIYASYHVTARANRQEMILESNMIKELFLMVVRRAKRKYSFIIKNFCIMGNHIHFIIKPTKKSNLSKIMQWILSVFALQFNKVYNYIGHVWYDRFSSKIIRTIWQYLATFIYISKNPVRAGIASREIDYPFNGLNHIQRGITDIMERPPTFLLSKIWPRLSQSPPSPFLPEKQ